MASKHLCRITTVLGFFILCTQLSSQTAFVILHDLPPLSEQARTTDSSRSGSAEMDENEIVLSRQQVAAKMRTAFAPSQDSVSAWLASLGATNIQRYTVINMLRATVPMSAMPMLQNHPDV